MYFEITREIVEERHRRLREAAQTPWPRFLARLSARLSRRQEPAQVIPLPRRDLDRLAA